MPSRTTGRVAMAALAVAATLGSAGTAVAAERYTARMTGTEEVPRGDEDGRGTARITIDRERGRVCYDIRLSRVGSVGAGHIHAGSRGEAGDVVVPLFDRPARRPKGCVRGISRSVLRKIERNPGQYYVNVHNARHPAGAVRGQLED